ncbi:MAG: hypothetical protein AB9861_03860 [Methanosarcina sp.]
MCLKILKEKLPSGENLKGKRVKYLHSLNRLAHRTRVTKDPGKKEKQNNT